MVTVITSKTCAYCPMVKKFLDYKHIDYREVDINDHPEDAPRDVLTVPVTILGDQRVVGYNLQKLSDLIKPLLTNN